MPIKKWIKQAYSIILCFMLFLFTGCGQTYEYDTAKPTFLFYNQKAQNLGLDVTIGAESIAILSRGNTYIHIGILPDIPLLVYDEYGLKSLFYILNKAAESVEWRAQIVAQPDFKYEMRRRGLMEIFLEMQHERLFELWPRDRLPAHFALEDLGIALIHGRFSPPYYKSHYYPSEEAYNHYEVTGVLFMPIPETYFGINEIYQLQIIIDALYEIIQELERQGPWGERGFSGIAFSIEGIRPELENRGLIEMIENTLIEVFYPVQ